MALPNRLPSDVQRIIGRREYDHWGEEILIDITESVFPPPKKAPISMQQLLVLEGESVADIGTGSGILAITAAKQKAQVYATDVSSAAIELAKHNAHLNEVDITFSQGEYFASFTQKFDVIVANLSQTLLPEKKQNSDKPLPKSINGGKNGNEYVLHFLEQARDFMYADHRTSRMIINVYTVSDYLNTIDYMLAHYNTQFLAQKPEPVKNFVEFNIDWYQELNQQGKIHIYQNAQKQWMANQFLFELTLK